jgi:uncharacterized protein YciI
LSFSVICLDGPDSGEKRIRIRLAHMEYVAQHQSKFLFGGPLLGDSGDIRVGMMFVLAFATRSDVEAFMADEPYTRAGVFESVIIRRFLAVFPESVPGFFSDLLRAERNRS